ncbi:hypothetical protein [Desulfotomaculum nigrificans]|uniref:hypothetical protein n=1 Tax=Desulfotomaculum nigrificans TaxID=1565 RepID=UPI0001FAEB2D|nr:hypothetical protein [Desulfotomaculum nigrificans]
MSDASRLEELAAKYKQKKKLNNQDKFEAEKYLEDFLQNNSYRTAGYGFMLSLPQDIAASAFLKVWLESDLTYREVLINELIEQKDFDGEAAYNRLIELIKGFAEVSGDVAVRLFAFLSEKLTKSCTDTPANKYVLKVKNALMENGVLLKISPDGQHLTARGKSCIAVLIMYALASKTDGENNDVGIIQAFVDWLNKLEKLFVISGKIREGLEKSAAKWPVELQRRCHEMGLVSVVTYLHPAKESVRPEENAVSSVFTSKQPYKPELTDAPNISKKKSSDNTPNERKENDKTETLKNRDFDPIQSLEQLRNYIDELEKTNKQNLNKICDALAKAEKERDIRLATERKLAETVTVVTKLKEENEKLKAETVQARSIITGLEKQLYDEKLKFENDKNQLFDMLELRPKQQLEQLKNRLQRKLRTDYLDFKLAENEQMTVELGENLRIQLSNVFNILSEEGIEFKGGIDR